MFQLRSVAMLSMAMLLAACNTVPMRASLTADQRGKIHELDAHVIVVQDEVIIDVKAPNTNAMAAGGGLIGALIVSAIDTHATNTRVNDSQMALGPFYAAIEDVDYRKQFTEAISAGLSSYPIKVGAYTATPRALTDAALAQMRKQLKPGQALMIVVPHYTLSADFRNFDAESIITIWFNDDNKQPAQRGVLHYQSENVGPGGKSSIEEWRAQDAAKFRQVLRESIDETLRMAMIDVDTPPDGDADAAKAKATSSFRMNLNGTHTDLKGHVVKAGDARIIVLGQDQKLYSLPNPAAPTPAPAPATTAAAADATAKQ